MASNSEQTIRKQADGGKKTSALGSCLNQGGDYHHSSGDDLPDILGQGDSKKVGGVQMGFGRLIGQSSKK